MANYEIKGNQIIAKMDRLTQKEIKEIRNFVSLFGYKVVTYEAPKLTKAEKEENKKRLSEEQKNNPRSKQNIEKYLKDNGTEEQKKKFKDIQNEIATDEQGNPKTYKNGKPIKKGFMGAYRYFKEQFPEYFENL